MGAFSSLYTKLMILYRVGGRNMRQLEIRLRSVQDVLAFVTVATARPFPIQVSNGNHQVNGKSFMEMFCLNLRKPVNVSFTCSDEEYDSFRRDTERFAVT